MDTEQVKALLRRYLDEEGSNGLAKRLDISRQHIWAILTGISQPGKDLLIALGLETRVQVVRTRRVDNVRIHTPPSIERRRYLTAANKAYWFVQKAILKGQLPSLRKTPTPCVDCGRRATAYDHRDYSRPTDVEPVCSRCNQKRGPAMWSNKDTPFEE